MKKGAFFLENKGNMHNFTKTENEIILWNSDIKIHLAPYGAGVRKIYIKNRNSIFKNIALALSHENDYLHCPLYAGATLAPTSGRIAEGILTLENQTFHLDKNENNQNHLHGGTHNLSFRQWDIVRKTDTDVLFTCFAADGVDGYPGNRRFSVEYILDGQRLEMHLYAESDRETYLNLSNHTYFNLNAFDRSGLEQYLQIRADHCIVNDEHHIPQNTIPVVHTEFDFRKETKLAERFNECDTSLQFRYAKGLNHYLLLSKHSPRIPACSLSSADQSVRMDLYTDAPALVVYTGGFIDHSFTMAEDEKRTYPGCALAIEPSFEPFHHVCPHVMKTFSRRITCHFHI